MTLSVFLPYKKDISVSFTIFVSEFAEMYTTFPFSATKIGQFLISAIFGTPMVLPYMVIGFLIADNLTAYVQNLEDTKPSLTFHPTCTLPAC